VVWVVVNNHGELQVGYKVNRSQWKMNMNIFLHVVTVTKSLNEHGSKVFVM